VFLIDFDLEAPGLTLMPEFHAPPGKEPTSPGGLAGFLQAGAENKPIPQIRDLAYAPVLSGDEKVEGRIHVLPAGDLRRGGEHYYVSRLGLRRLYIDKQRSVVMDDLKAQIEDEYAPDYVLVDSRTGLTEVGGITTVDLADLVVVLFGLNEQNVAGTALVLRRLKEARPDLHEHVVFVASPMPNGEEMLKQDRLRSAVERYAEALEIDKDRMPDVLSLPYHPHVALSEESFIARFPDTYLTEAYGRLLSELRRRNPHDLRHRFESALRLIATNPPRGMEALQEVARSPDAPPEALGLHAVVLARLGKGQAEEAEKYFRRAIEADPKHAINLGSYALFLEQRERFEEAEEHYRRAIEADPKDAGNLGNYATFLADRERFEDAEQHFRRAMEADPKDARVLASYGWLLYEWRDDLRGALDCTERAAALDPDAPSIACNRALFLLLLGREGEARAQYEQVIPRIPCREELVRRALTDLKDAAAKKPQDKTIPATLSWLEKEWEERHGTPPDHP